jgi:NADH-quinone oxidoreductase subunit L
MCYGYPKISHHLVALRFGYLYKLTLSKFYIDEFYQWVIDKIVLSAARFISIFDRVVVNDTGVDGMGMSVLLSAFKVRLIQTGKLYNYGAAMGMGIFFMAVMWILVSN